MFSRLYGTLTPVLKPCQVRAFESKIHELPAKYGQHSQRRITGHFTVMSNQFSAGTYLSTYQMIGFQNY